MSEFKYTKEYLNENKISIECATLEEAKRINEIFNADCISSWSNHTMYFGSAYSETPMMRFWNADQIGECLIASEVIAQYEAQNPKIIGYRCPFDMYQQENDFLVNKGDLYVIAHEGSNCYAPKKWIECDLPKDIKTLYIPFEIIEQLFEPVYEEVKPCFSSFEEIVNHFKGQLVTICTGIVVYSKETNDPFSLNKMNYDFTLEFESKLKDMGIDI